jgi:hypothetical protein
MPHICGVEVRRDTSQLELKRKSLLATDEMEPKGRLGTEMKAAVTVGKITPKPAFRLLTLVLLIFALADLVPATGVWRIVVGGATALVLAGIVTAWIGLDRVPGRGTPKLRSDRSSPPPFGLAHHSTTRWGTGPGQP